MSAPDLTQVNGFAYQPGDLILDPKTPMISARRLLEDRYTLGGQRALHHYKGAFYGWTGTHYLEVSDAFITSDIYHFLEYAKRQTGKTLADFEPNRNRTGEILAGLRAATHVSDLLNAPMWQGEAPDLNAADILACSNGLLHLPTRELLPHQPDFFTLNAIDYSYSAGASEAPSWFTFLASLWGEDQESIAALQEIFGYCLVSDTTQQKAFMLVGPKRSGKGTIARLLSATVGPHNVVAPTLSGLSTNFGMAPLIGKRVAIISDARLSGRVDAAVIAERLLSISGEDGMTVDRKNRDAWTGKLDIRFFLISNELPRIGDVSGALASRFIVLLLSESFFGREDHGLTARLLQERPAILNWALDGYARLRKRGFFKQPSAAQDAVEELHDLGSPMSAFLRDECSVAAGRSVECSMLFDAWRRWCERQGRRESGTLQTFSRDLRTLIPTLKTTQPRTDYGRMRQFEGVGLI